MINKVIKILEDERKYDFDSEFWTDDMTTMMAEIMEATERVFKQPIPPIDSNCKCCGKNTAEVCGSCISEIAQDTSSHALQTK